MTQNNRGCWWGGAGVALLVAALVPGCGGSSVGVPDGSAAPVALEALPEQLAKTACESISGCCHSAAIAFDLATCRANVKAQLEKQLMSVPMRPNVRYDASAAGACVAAFGAYFKRCVEGGSADMDDACERVFVGTIALGGACTRGDECAPGADGRVSCEFEFDAPQGVCVAPTAQATPHGKLGEACSGTCTENGDCEQAAMIGAAWPGGTNTVCFADEGLHCDFGTHTCQHLVGLGGACSSGGCVAAAYCTDAGTCAAPKPDGAACTDSRECTSSRCVFNVEVTGGTCGTVSLATPNNCDGTQLID